MIFKGSGVALITPMKKDQSVDWEGLNILIDFHLANGTDALIVTGTTGEASTLREDEKIEIIKTTVERVNGKIPVIAGTGSNDTYSAVDFSQKVASLGVDGLLVVTPYYNKGSESGIIMHLKEVAQAAYPVPILLYSVPGRTGVHLSVRAVKELSLVENIDGIKDATGDLSYTQDIRNACDESFAIYSGNDDLIVPLLACGGVGVISVLANALPRETHDMVIAYLSGDSKSATILQLQMKALIDALFVETNPIPIKALLQMINLPAGPLRLPLTDAMPSTIHALEKAWACLEKES